ncbi:MAG: hypothetical protein HY231_16400 [Acidobacteria bacterium]|nr:hypothetical protein [Acidobacteriota bacterium]
MKSLKIAALAAAILFFAASANSVFAQGPLQKEIDFTINHPFEMSKSNIVLPAGKYILYQIDENDLDLFALYRNNRMHAPIAMVRTTRIDYTGSSYPGKDKMLVKIDEEGPVLMPVINGWNIAGSDGWEIIAIVPDRERMEMAGSRISMKNDLHQSKLQKDRVVVSMSTFGF